ncbi:hypothetical protein BDW67DRAFT_168745 [Aspergillus spinulosporus]
MGVPALLVLGGSSPARQLCLSFCIIPGCWLPFCWRQWAIVDGVTGGRNGSKNLSVEGVWTTVQVAVDVKSNLLFNGRLYFQLNSIGDKNASWWKQAFICTPSPFRARDTLYRGSESKWSRLGVRSHDGSLFFIQ